MTVVNTCQIGADSLLGVKYVLSVYPVNGLVESDRLAGHGDRKIYENPYWLPFAFTCDGKVWSELNRGSRGRRELYQEILAATAALGGEADVR